MVLPAKARAIQSHTGSDSTHLQGTAEGDAVDDLVYEVLEKSNDAPSEPEQSAAQEEEAAMQSEFAALEIAMNQATRNGNVYSETTGMGQSSLGGGGGGGGGLNIEREHALASPQQQQANERRKQRAREEAARKDELRRIQLERATRQRLAAANKEALSASSGAFGETNASGSAWREFAHDSEAGRLLHRLYAKTHNQPLVKYPRLRQGRSLEDDGSRPNWTNAQASADLRFRNQVKERQLQVEAPRVSRGSKPRARAAIHRVPRRRPWESIEAELRESESHRSVDRPMPRKAVSTDFEKRKLALICQFKGGKVLPDCGTAVPMQGHIPLSLITGKPQQKRKVSSLQQRKMEEERVRLAQEAKQGEKQRLESEFDMLSTEVEDIRSKIEHLQMSHTHASNRKVGELRQELVGRLGEMETIDQTIRSGCI